MARAGTNENQILTYIQNTPAAYVNTAQEVVTLSSLGISPRILTALLERRPAPSAEKGPGGQGAEAAAEESRIADYSAFYNGLAPYGSWRNFPTYGWCWQPVAATVNPDWRPYASDGRWVWSQSGWYWSSYYSWGAVPFHFGRWWKHPIDGWFWQPGHVWGPAWVTWRESPNYCGWAPLPPGADFAVGRGWTFQGRGVNRRLGFGLPASAFTFVPMDRFNAPSPGDYALSPERAQWAFSWSEGIDGFVLGPNRLPINLGIDPRQVGAATGNPMEPMALADLDGGASPTSGSAGDMDGDNDSEAADGTAGPGYYGGKSLLYYYPAYVPAGGRSGTQLAFQNTTSFGHGGFSAGGGKSLGLSSPSRSSQKTVTFSTAPFAPVGSIQPAAGAAPWGPVGSVAPTPGGSPFAPVGSVAVNSSAGSWAPVGSVRPAAGTAAWAPSGSTRSAAGTASAFGAAVGRR
jgi:hypothetical protein